MGDEHVEFLEGPLIEQKVYPLARRQLTLGVLRVDPALTAALPCDLPTGFKLFENVFHGRSPPEMPRGTPERPTMLRAHHICGTGADKGELSKFA
jgi:hypothetical protein